MRTRCTVTRHHLTDFGVTAPQHDADQQIGIGQIEHRRQSPERRAIERGHVPNHQHRDRRVSDRLADLIQSISSATEQQANSATGVATNIQNILSVTETTREGTRQTALSIRELSKLAEDLKSSVSRFRVTN